MQVLLLAVTLVGASAQAAAPPETLLKDVDAGSRVVFPRGLDLPVAPPAIRTSEQWVVTFQDGRPFGHHFGWEFDPAKPYCQISLERLDRSLTEPQTLIFSRRYGPGSAEAWSVFPPMGWVHYEVRGNSGYRLGCTRHDATPLTVGDIHRAFGRERAIVFFPPRREAELREARVLDSFTRLERAVFGDVERGCPTRATRP